MHSDTLRRIQPFAITAVLSALLSGLITGAIMWNRSVPVEFSHPVNGDQFVDKNVPYPMHGPMEILFVSSAARPERPDSAESAPYDKFMRVDRHDSEWLPDRHYRIDPFHCPRCDTPLHVPRGHRVRCGTCALIMDRADHGQRLDFWREGMPRNLPASFLKNNFLQ